MRKGKRLSLFLLLVLLTPSVWAQAPKLTLTGRVLDGETNEPVPFATVFVPGTRMGTTSDVDGHFKLAVEAGVDSLAATAMGFQK